MWYDVSPTNYIQSETCTNLLEKVAARSFINKANHAATSLFSGVADIARNRTLSNANKLKGLSVTPGEQARLMHTARRSSQRAEAASNRLNRMFNDPAAAHYGISKEQYSAVRGHIGAHASRVGATTGKNMTANGFVRKDIGYSNNIGDSSYFNRVYDKING